MSSPVLVVQHEDDDPIHLMGQWMGVDLDVRRPFLGDELPASLDGYAALVVMGGAMGANDDATFPWLTAVKELIRQAAADRVPTLGICLGHQLAAVALGGEVRRNPAGRQFGLYDVGWEPAAHLDELFAPVATPRRGAHWNDDIVTRLPAGAQVMARADAGDVQAVHYAPTVWGVQWHPEVDEPLFRGWLADGDADPAVAEDALAALAAARDQLVEWWTPLAVRFAELAARHATQVEAARA
ncbi:type 1 glutamine amidotransferase [Nocardioides cynanchi]|uniref:type 1 glutamine amidotransferase n=1 Tax=Nocardioides cynanchi TaxID=2558918 RepID=UPI001245A850|nr:type 1 glutamine amidotransferase [Nocardioides cynanchi]